MNREEYINTIAMGCGILTTYSEIANISGLHGLLVYTITGAIPLLGFALFGPIIRKKCPDGFIFTEWVRQRYGIVAALYISFFTCLTMFLFMLGELTAIRGAIETLTGVNALAAVIVECVVTSIYTAIGGFHVSFITDNFQGVCVILLLIICGAGIGSYIHIDRAEIGPSKLLKANKLGWQLLYILFVAILTNDCFMSGFWLRTFASRTNKDLWIGTSIAAFSVFVICTLVGTTGFLAVWSGDLEPSDPNGYNAFFILLSKMPRWVVAFVLIFSIMLSTCTFDSLQSAFVSTISNDVFRNRLNINYIRIMVVLIMVPIVVLAVKVANDIMQIYLIADLVSAAIIPSIFLGLSDTYFWYLTGADVMCGGLGALLGVFIFGTVYYHSAREGGKLLLIWNGIYDPEDWGAFGAFVIAPFGGIVITLSSVLIRVSVTYIYCKLFNKQFTALDKPVIEESDSIADVSVVDEPLNYNSTDESLKKAS